MAHNPKKILITGSSGLIGRELADFLQSQGHDVVRVDNNSRFPNRVLDSNTVSSGLCEFLNNCTNDFDYIYHMAAINGTSAFYDNPTKVLENNILLDLAIMKFAEGNSKCKLIYASSSEVVAGTTTFPTPEEVDITIENIHNPRWSYRLPKIVAENYLFNSNIDFVIFRFFNVISEDSGPGHFLRDIVDKLRSNKFEVDSPDETRSFCYVKDIVEPLVIAAEYSSRELFNIGSQEEITVLSAANIIADAHDVVPDWIYKDSKEGSVRRRCPDTSKLRTKVGGYTLSTFVEIINRIKDKL